MASRCLSGVSSLLFHSQALPIPYAMVFFLNRGVFLPFRCCPLGLPLFPPRLSVPIVHDPIKRPPFSTKSSQISKAEITFPSCKLLTAHCECLRDLGHPSASWIIHIHVFYSSILGPHLPKGRKISSLKFCLPLPPRTPSPNKLLRKNQTLKRLHFALTPAKIKQLTRPSE